MRLPSLAFEASASAIPPLRLALLDMQVYCHWKRFGFPARCFDRVALVVFLHYQATCQRFFLRVGYSASGAAVNTVPYFDLYIMVGRDVLYPVGSVAAARQHIERWGGGTVGKPYFYSMSPSALAPRSSQVAVLLGFG